MAETHTPRTADGSPRTAYIAVPALPGGDPETANQVWLAAIRDMAQQRGINLAAAFGVSQPAPGLPRFTAAPPARVDPSSCETTAEFLACMRELRAWAGQPSLHELERRAAARGAHLPHSTLGRVLSLNRTLLPSSAIVISFTTACGAGEFTNEWLKTWQRILYFAGMPLPEQVKRQRKTRGMGSYTTNIGGAKSV